MVKLDVESKEKILDETLIQNKEDSAIKKKTKKMASPFLGYSMVNLHTFVFVLNVLFVLYY